SPGLFAGQPATPRARSTGFRGPPGSRDARRSAPPRRRPGSSASRTGSGEARREPHGARKEPSPRTRSPRHQRRRSCTTPPRSRPPAQSTIGSSTSTLSQWCSWSTQAPPCWTSEGTGLVILFLSLSISLSDFSAPTKLRSGRLLPPRGTRLPRCERIVSETVLLHDAVAERACLAGVPLLSVRTAGARRARTDRTVRGSGDYAQRGARRSEKGPPSVPSVPSCHLS
ncbi:unnamed protein product, partial [Prorocentrum cordatum]